MKFCLLNAVVVGAVFLWGTPSTGVEKDSASNQDEQSSIFEAPVRLKAGGEFISVESPGYACPTIADVDGDGKADLVVGQFRNGNMRFFKNIAESEGPPTFAAGEWLKTNDERATVPGVW